MDIQNRIDVLKNKFMVAELAAILAVLTDGNQDDAVELAKMSEDYLARKVEKAETLSRSAEDVHAELTGAPKPTTRTQKQRVYRPVSPTPPQKGGIWALVKRNFSFGAGTDSKEN